MPDVLDRRDAFISKFYETLALAKAEAVSNGPEYTSRLHVAELELFCNVFTQSQYRDFKFKGEATLFYTSAPNPPVDITPFTRLPQFVGMIQATDAGFRTVMRSKINLNGMGDSARDTNPILDMDAFQIHVTELGKCDQLKALYPRIHCFHGFIYAYDSSLGTLRHHSGEPSMDSVRF
jgi:hypothetical protein